MIIDRASPLPLYQQVKRHLLDLMESGDIPAGTKLASERQLIGSLGVSRITVRHAMRELVMEGHLKSFPGKGFYPASPENRHGRRSYEIDLLRSFTETARAHGSRPESRLVSAGLVPATGQVARLLGVGRGDGIVELRRLRLIDGDVVMLCSDWLPATRAAALLDLDWSVPDRSLYAELIGRLGLRPCRGRTGISARLATVSEIADLALDDPAAVLVVEQVACDDAGRVINASLAIQRPDLFPMTLEQGAALPTSE